MFNWKEPRPLGLDANAQPSCCTTVAQPVPMLAVLRKRNASLTKYAKNAKKKIIDRKA